MASKTPEQKITGNVIPVHYNSGPLASINIKLPPKLPKYSVLGPLSPLGTRSAFGFLPNLANRPRNAVNSVIRASGAMNELPLPPGPPPLPPGPPPASALRAYPDPALVNNYSSSFNAAYNVPNWQKPPPPMEHWIHHLKNGGRLYRDQFTKEDWRRVWNFIELHRDINNVRYWSKDNKTGKSELHPYFYIPKSAVSKTRRKRKQSRHTRRRHR